MKICVIVPVYQRGESHTYLFKTLQMLENQTYKSFKVFVIGDCYKNNEIFVKYCKAYSGDIYYENLNFHYRNIFKNPMTTWAIGGGNAILHGIQKAINENYNYYFHLDDDDLWSNDYIAYCVEHLQKYPSCDFMITKSSYKKTRVLPVEHIDGIYLNNFSPRGGNSVHSSWLINLDKLGNLFVQHYTNERDYAINVMNNKIKEKSHIPPSDAIILNKIKNMQSGKQVNCLCLSQIKVFKDNGDQTHLRYLRE